MAVETIFQGSLFSTDFLSESITRNANWQRIFDAEIERIATDLRGIFAWQCQEFRVWAAVEHQAARALTKRSPKMTAN